MTKVATKKTADKTAPAKSAARGPKQGSARANQTAGYAKGELTKPKVNPDNITSVKGTSDGTGYTAVTAASGKTEMVKDNRMTGQLRKLAVVGASFKAVQEYLKANKPEAKLARGLDGKTAPQSAMAAAASRATGKADAPAAKAPAAKASSAKASAGNKLSRKGTQRTYKATKKEDVSRDGTFRKYMISTIRAHTDTETAKAAHAKSGQYAKDKLNFNWAEQNGFITWA